MTAEAGRSAPAPGYLGPKSPRGTEDPASVGDDGPPVLPYPLGQSWFERLITLRLLSHRQGEWNPIDDGYDDVRRAADEAFDMAVDEVRRALADMALRSFNHGVDVGEYPTWRCKDCYWIGPMGEAAFRIGNQFPYCPQCCGDLEALL